MPGSDDTIFAVASGFGRAALAVIRISGSRTDALLQAVAGSLPSARKLSLRTLRDPRSGEALDEALVAWMPGPASFTGEDQAELHIHGGVAVRAAILRVLADQAGCRPAEPGEFTRRAFLNGRMDLSRAEGLADLIDAETDAQRRQALRQLEGRLGNLVESWREQTIEALSLLEAALDFADEGDVPEHLEREAAGLIEGLERAIATTLDEGSRGERLRDGFVVVLAGPPNSGKSTLLNALAQREVAIVSAIPGTTRDAIELRADLGGLPVTFIDTAGLRDTDDPIEREGVARTRARAAAADLVLWLIAADLAEVGPGPELGTCPVLPIGTKSDMGGTSCGELQVSAATRQGLDQLLARIEAEARAALGSGEAAITRERHRRVLERACDALRRGRQALAAEQAELAAEDVRLALRALGEITGRVDVEHVLDRLFASFCIGK